MFDGIFASVQLDFFPKMLFCKVVILLMEEIRRSPPGVYHGGINYISTGAGFLPSTQYYRSYIGNGVFCL